MFDQSFMIESSEINQKVTHSVLLYTGVYS